MINIERESHTPEALTTADIQNYIRAAVEYLKDTKNNLKPEKPESYRSSDLLEAFDKIFHAKCYMTETKHANSWVMDIEHFIPQAERPDLVYEWTNLFPANHYANLIKPRKTPDGGYLNPCETSEDVEIEIIYTLSTYGEEPFFEARDNTNIKAKNTAELLNRVHNGHDDNTKKGTSDLRHAIHKKYIDILKTKLKWREAKDDSQEKFQAARELRDLLSRKSSFTMLCRSMPAVQDLPSEFFD